MEISIHVPIAGNDPIEEVDVEKEFNISIHVPIAGNDDECSIIIEDGYVFQSTFPLQGTTIFWCLRCLRL